ncbi:MAG: excinuclease ABC subunit UvrA [Thermodesulfobacteriota bacterium]|nr:excinuclease ABC subunit UvrA [Thermodesulfobacteriota bacterium]
MQKKISVVGASQNNLKGIDFQIPWYQLCVVTGLSGSGKSSLAIETIHSESRRRYLESLSTYARQFLERIDKPNVLSIDGVPPSISIESRNSVKNSRSTVGTLTDIYDYMRIIFSRSGKIYCPDCDMECASLSNENIFNNLFLHYKNQEISICISKENETKYSTLRKIGIVEAIVAGKTVLIDKNNNKDALEIYPLIDTISINKKNQSRIIESVELAFGLSKTIYIFNKKKSALRTFKKEFCCPSCFTEFKRPSPNQLSFNSPDGACKECKGFGNILLPDLNLIVSDKKKSIREGCIGILGRRSYSHDKKRFMEFCSRRKINIDTPYDALSKDAIHLILNGDDKYKGLTGFFKRLERKRYKIYIRVLLSKFRTPAECKSCQGSRINPIASKIRFGDRTIKELCSLSIDKLLKFLVGIKLTKKDRDIVDEPLRQCTERLNYLVEVGLEYLTLARLGRTLSGGEAQRVNLAQQLGSRLTDTLYVLDEPSIGLHPKDIERLLKTIKNLRDLDNTIVLIEHDLDIISKADWIIELGPRSGDNGGRLIYCGPTENINTKKESITNKYLTGNLFVETPRQRRSSTQKLKMKYASKNNLKKVSCDIPLNCITCVTGVSGSGKSTLIKDCLYGNAIREYGQSYESPGNVSSISGLHNLKEIVMITQETIGTSNRSNPASYMKIYDDIRKIMSESPDAKKVSLRPGDFSFNTDGGRCDDCKGDGKKKIEMQFLSDLEVDCDSCNGKKFKDHILDIQYKGQNINNILDFTVDEARRFFENNKKIIDKLDILSSVGLDYLQLGQPSNTLSGGESQRIKIAKSLLAKNSTNVLYILDEPSIGLHLEDLKNLINTFELIIEKENSIIVIEHNVELIKIADYIIDMGPGGGSNGGKIIATGTPEEIQKNRLSIIGQYLSL